MKIDLGNSDWRTTFPPTRSVASDAPAIACAFSRDGKTVAFALGLPRFAEHESAVHHDLHRAMAEHQHVGLAGRQAAELERDQAMADGVIVHGADEARARTVRGAAVRMDEEVAQAAGDARAQAIFRSVGEHLGVALAALINKPAPPPA